MLKVPLTLLFIYYFNQLEHIIDKYELQNSPHLIFNVDEKGISTNHTPSRIVAGRYFYPQSITTGKSKTITVLGCGSASGVAIPPYFVFPGKRMMPDLLKDASPVAKMVQCLIRDGLTLLSFVII